MNKMYIAIIGASTLVVASALGGYLGMQYMAAHQNAPATVDSQDAEAAPSEAADSLRIYREALAEIKQGNYALACDDLLQYKDQRMGEQDATAINAAYAYARAKLYLQESDRQAALELLNKVPTGYTGELAQEIGTLKAQLTPEERNDDKPSVNGQPHQVSAGSDNMVVYGQKLTLVHTRLQNQLAAIVDQEEQNEIAYKQGFLSIGEYYTKKAAFDVARQQNRLNAIDQEIGIIQDTTFASREEKDLELANAQERKRRITAELNKAARAQVGVQNILTEYRNVQLKGI